MAHLPYDYASETELLIRLDFGGHGVCIRHPHAAGGIRFFQKLGMEGHVAPVMTMCNCFPGFFLGTVEAYCLWTRLRC